VPAKPRECRARVTALRTLAPDVLAADLRLEDPPTFAFDAGQWVSVPFGPKTVRAYTIASTPQTRTHITLCADVAPDGIGSRWFKALAPGDEVRFKGPTGGFVYARSDPRPPLFVAEEIGIVPVRAILSDLFETGFGRPSVLVYGARRADALAYHDELIRLARRYPGFSYHPVIGGTAEGWNGERGDLVEAMKRVAPATQTVAYVAGGGDTINRVRDALMARGFDRKSVKWERFW